MSGNHSNPSLDAVLIRSSFGGWEIENVAGVATPMSVRLKTKLATIVAQPRFAIITLLRKRDRTCFLTPLIHLLAFLLSFQGQQNC